MSDLQKTLKEEVTLSGIGLHTGKEVNLTIKPAKENTGFVFVRTDLEGNPQVEADVNYVTTTERGTTLEKLGVKIHTCEHLLAALVGCDIDNAILEMDSAEPPIMDGSSIHFVEAIEKAGIAEQSKPREYLVIKEVLNYTDPNTGSEITIIPSEQYEVTTMVDFGTKVLGTQNATLKNISDFKSEISSARTFSFLHELEMLLDHGLIKGGDLSNAIVYVDKELTPDTAEKLKKAFNKDKISIQPNGILDNLTLKYPNEAARHKLLDVIGDLALVGVKIKGKVIANKPGHFVNTQFAKKLNRQWKLQKKKNVPDFDLSKPPVYDINGIMRLLPHRPPFLLIDKILELSESHVVGLKNITMNEGILTAEVYSFTKQVTNTVSIASKYLSENDKVLIVDDFLANGQAAKGLIEIVEQAGAKVEAVGIVIEKSFQEGRKLLEEDKRKVVSLARIQKFENRKIVFMEADA